jgi:hypothetical protein
VFVCVCGRGGGGTVNPITEKLRENVRVPVAYATQRTWKLPEEKKKGNVISYDANGNTKAQFPLAVFIPIETFENGRWRRKMKKRKRWWFGSVNDRASTLAQCQRCAVIAPHVCARCERERKRAGPFSS